MDTSKKFESDYFSNCETQCLRVGNYLEEMHSLNNKQTLHQSVDSLTEYLKKVIVENRVT